MLNFSIPMRALSFNHYQKSARNGRRYTTAKGKEYTDQLKLCLDPFRSSLISLAKNIKDHEMFELEIIYHYSNFYTKKNTISKTCNDVDNPNKVLIDTLFKVMGCDDYRLGKLTCEKVPSEKDNIWIKIGTIPIDLSNNYIEEAQSEHSLMIEEMTW